MSVDSPRTGFAVGQGDNVLVFPIIVRPHPQADAERVTVIAGGRTEQFDSMADLHTAVLAVNAPTINGVRDRAVAAAIDAERQRAARQVADYQARRRAQAWVFVRVAVLTGVTAALIFGAAEFVQRMGWLS